MLGLQTESMGIRIVSVGGRRSADWLCPHEPSRSRLGSLDELSDVLPGILVSARPRRNAQVVLQLVYSGFRVGKFGELAGAMASGRRRQSRMPRRSSAKPDSRKSSQSQALVADESSVWLLGSNYLKLWLSHNYC